MKILFVINILSRQGAANAMVDLALGLKKLYRGTSMTIFARYNSSENFEYLNAMMPIKVGSEEDLLKELNGNNYDLIHWFRSNSSVFFDNFHKLSATTNRPPLILTHCQLPSNHSLRLSWSELRFTTHFVFICKHAYGHPYHQFISSDDKSMIYFGYGGDVKNRRVLDGKKGISNVDRGEGVTFARGSNLNKFKIPNNLLKVFSKIQNKDINFFIVGSGDKSSLVADIEKYDLKSRVHLMDQMDIDDWFAFIDSIDVFYYHLPDNSYSAIDATIQHAMSSGKPILYKGPEAPSELIEHGRSGLIARTNQELIDFALLLSKDYDLRETLGNGAKERISSKFNSKTTISKYFELYHKLKFTPKNALRHSFRRLPITVFIGYCLSAVKFRFTKS